MSISTKTFSKFICYSNQVIKLIWYYNLILESNERVENSNEQRIKRESDSSNVSNIFISPSSIFQSLMLAYFGAAGETEAELAKTMGFSSVDRDLIKKSYVFERAFQVIILNLYLHFSFWNLRFKY